MASCVCSCSWRKALSVSWAWHGYGQSGSISRCQRLCAVPLRWVRSAEYRLRLESRRRVRTGSSPLTGAASVRLCASIGRVFCSSPGRHRRALTTRLGFVHGNGALPCTNPAGVRWACRLRPGEVQNTRCATTAEVKISYWGPSHVEMPTPP